MQSILGMPEDKRAHWFIPLDKEGFYYPGGCSDEYTAIEINMMAGRSAETQKALIPLITIDNPIDTHRIYSPEEPSVVVVDGIQPGFLFNAQSG